MDAGQGDSAAEAAVGHRVTHVVTCAQQALIPEE